MKKMTILLAAVFLLNGCDGKEKTELIGVLTNKYKEDKDLADYSIDPEDMADCVVGKLLADVPGFPGSPNRTKYIAAYLKLASVNEPEDIKPALDNAKEVFGSMKAANEAASSITMHTFACIGDMVDSNPNAMGRPQ